LLQWAVGSRIAAADGSAPFTTILYFSGNTFFTLAFGDAVPPPTALSRFLAIAEAATGFGFLGIIIAYLPAFYQDYERREVRLSMLDEWAGSPVNCGVCGKFPPEPLRFVGGLVVRQAVRHKESREDRGKSVDPVTKAVAGLAPQGFFRARR